jgi:2-(1,2-epoxy-1,2-dihydrophenyl)acetyl-CoA isomerase
MNQLNEAVTSPALLFEKYNGIATLTLNRPKVRNAITTDMFLDMERYLIEIAADEEVRVVVLAGAGGVFSAGADLNPQSKDERIRTQASSFPGDQGGDILERGNRCILRLQQMPKPVLGSVSGNAVGIGCCLALATDLRIVSDTARFGIVFSKIGLGPDGGASYFLRNLIGTAKALELMFLGDFVDATQALELGLVNRVVASEQLEKATYELAERLAQGPTLAYAMAKAAIYQGANLPLASVLDLETRNQRIATRSHDANEGIKAFLERRKPKFQGR